MSYNQQTWLSQTNRKSVTAIRRRTNIYYGVKR